MCQASREPTSAFGSAISCDRASPVDGRPDIAPATNVAHDRALHAGRAPGSSPSRRPGAATAIWASPPRTACKARTRARNTPTTRSLGRSAADPPARHPGDEAWARKDTLGLARLRPIRVYNAVTDSWQQISPIPTALREIASVLQRRIFVVGNAATTSASDHVEAPGPSGPRPAWQARSAPESRRPGRRGASASLRLRVAIMKLHRQPK